MNRAPLLDPAMADLAMKRLATAATVHDAVTDIRRAYRLLNGADNPDIDEHLNVLVSCVDTPSALQRVMAKRTGDTSAYMPSTYMRIVNQERCPNVLDRIQERLELADDQAQTCKQRALRDRRAGGQPGTAGTNRSLWHMQVNRCRASIERCRLEALLSLVALLGWQN